MQPSQDKPSLRLRIASSVARRIAGAEQKDFIPALTPWSGWSLDEAGRMNQYNTAPDMIKANAGWVWAANTAIADPASAVPITLFRKQKDGDREQIFDHPLLDLVNNPNIAFTGEQMRQLHFTYMNLVGEGYLLMLKGKKPFKPVRGQLPDALQTLPSHRIRFELGNMYSQSKVKIDRKEYSIETIIRDFNPDPANPYYGRSVISASAGIIDLENQMLEWNRRMGANAMRPSMVISTPQTIENAAFERYKQQINAMHTGSENAFKPLLIEGGATITNGMLKPVEMEFLATREFSMKEILSMFRLSPAMLGQVENVNRSNLEAGFYVNAVINIVPRVRQFVRQMNATLVSIFDPTLELDYENPVPEDIKAKLEAASEGVDKWWTKDEVRDMYGEKPLPDGLGEHIIVPGKSPTPLETILQGISPDGPTQPQDPQDPDDDNDDDLTEAPSNNDPEAQDGKKTLELQKKKSLSNEEIAKLKDDRRKAGDAKIERYEHQLSIYETSIKTVCAQQFRMQLNSILERADSTQLHKSLDSATSQNQRQTRKRDWLTALIAWAEFDDSMRKALAPLFFALMVETGPQAMREINLDPSMFNPTDLAILNFSQHQAAHLAHEVNHETEKQLRATLSQGIDQGENDNQLRARIEHVMGFALTVRTARIARTEGKRAQGHADQVAWQQSGMVSAKEWSTHSADPCAFCQSMNGTIVELSRDFLHLGDKLSAGGKTMNVTYSSVPYPPVHPNCQCTLQPVMASFPTD